MLNLEEFGRALMKYAEAQQNAINDLKYACAQLNELLSPYRCLWCDQPMAEELKYCSPECAEAKANELELKETKITGN